MVGLIFGILVGLILLVYAWVQGINNMKENHPDYKGEDLFDEDETNTLI